MTNHRHDIKEIMEDAFKQYQDNTEGKNASYIPYLNSVQSDLGGVAFVSTSGEIINIHDAEYLFAIESISKIMTMGLALEQHNANLIKSKIGTNPTGLPFNSVLALELHKGKPLTPLVNAGAIATTSLIEAKNKEDRWQKILNFQSELSATKIELSEDINNSEQKTNTHNQAISLLLSSYNNIYSDPLEACEIYTRQCSTLFNCISLATVGATLANGGINPISKKRILSKSNIPHILAEMVMEGLYETSGDWAYTVGLPSKSGVGGGLLSIIPNIGALAAFSPRLDKHGNSVRAQLMIKKIAKTMNWNIFNCDFNINTIK